MKKTAAAILSLLLMTGAVAGMADGAYTPGTYRQSAKGMGGDVVVDVTFDADAMTAIDVVSQNETAGLGDVALTSVAQAMLDAQSADVDGVAGRRRFPARRSSRRFLRPSPRRAAKSRPRRILCPAPTPRPRRATTAR